MDLSRLDRPIDPDAFGAGSEGSGDAGAESSTAADAGAESSTAEEEGAAQSATTSGAAGARPEGQGDDESLPFHRHPRWQEVQKRNREMADRVAALEREREQERREAADLRESLGRMKRLEEMDEWFRSNPQAAEQAEKILRLAGEIPADVRAGATDDPVKAEVVALRTRLAELERGTRADRETAEEQSRYVAEVQAINASLLQEGAAPDDHQFLGETIHAKYRASRARGSKVSLEQVAKDVIAWRKQDVAATIERYKKDKTAQAGRTPTVKPGGKVPMSTEAERARSQLSRKADGRIDPGWADRAGNRFEAYLRDQDAGKTG